MKAEVESIDGNSIKLKDRCDGPYLSDWQKAHGQISVGQMLDVVWETKKNSFGTHFYGFVPEGFHLENGWTRDEPND